MCASVELLSGILQMESPSNNNVTFMRFNMIHWKQNCHKVGRSKLFPDNHLVTNCRSDIWKKIAMPSFQTSIGIDKSKNKRCNIILVNAGH